MHNGFVVKTVAVHREGVPLFCFYAVAVPSLECPLFNGSLSGQ